MIYLKNYSYCSYYLYESFIFVMLIRASRVKNHIPTRLSTIYTYTRIKEAIYWRYWYSWSIHLYLYSNVICKYYFMWNVIENKINFPFLQIMLLSVCSENKNAKSINQYTSNYWNFWLLMHLLLFYLNLLKPNCFSFGAVNGFSHKHRHT